MRASGLLITALMLLAGCSAAEPNNETTGRKGETMKIRVEQLAEGQRGPAARGVTVAGSARELEAATGLRIPDSGEGLYICARAGERPTGGYRVGVPGGEGDAVQVRLREPGDGDIVTQALTSP